MGAKPKGVRLLSGLSKDVDTAGRMINTDRSTKGKSGDREERENTEMRTKRTPPLTEQHE